MTKEAPIAAFCSSDEEEEDKGAVLYLPIAPEIEDPEENFVPGIDSLSPTPGIISCVFVLLVWGPREGLKFRTNDSKSVSNKHTIKGCVRCS